VQHDAHGCPACPHPSLGPAIQGSPDVNVNGMPALRVDDVGKHAPCCGPATWTAQSGSSSVFINGKAAFRMNDPSRHCGGRGKLIEGSANVIVGDGDGGGGGSGASSGGSGGGGGGGSSGGSGGGSGSGGGAGGAASGGAGSTPPPAQQKHWIEIELKSASGKPMAGERYSIRKPDGTVASGTLDADGRARLDGLEPGSCKVCFPDIDGDQWRPV
jgi:uncharacterized Zn-binding protein involved in type VI secretion